MFAICRSQAETPRRFRLPVASDAVKELLTELQTTAPGERAQLEVLVREAVETLVYGD